MTVYKAQWPLSGDKKILIYEADLPPEKRNLRMFTANDRVKKNLFQDKFIRVFFEGTCDDDSYWVDHMVRHEQWIEVNPTTGERIS